MTLYGIVALDRSGAIGYKNKLPWGYIKEDMERFKALTMGATVIMGRKTFESLPKKARPLPGRMNIVITSEPERYGYLAQDTLKFMDMPEVHEYLHASEMHRVFLIGGASIWYHLYDYIQVFYITHVIENVMADTFIARKQILYDFKNIVYSSKVKCRGDVQFFFEVRTRKMIPGIAM